MLAQKQKQKQKNCLRYRTQLEFNQIFEDKANSSCFQCGKQSKQWVQSRHAIYLCLSCAKMCSELERVCNIKSVAIDSWSDLEIGMLKRGGNARLKNYLAKYGLDTATLQIALQSKAAQFYRLYLLNPNKLSLNDAPAYQVGTITQGVSSSSSSHATSQIIMDVAKQKLSTAAQTTLYYGNKALQTIQNKIPLQQIQAQAHNVAGKASETAKNIWAFVSNKINKFDHNFKQNAKVINQPIY